MLPVPCYSCLAVFGDAVARTTCGIANASELFGVLSNVEVNQRAQRVWLNLVLGLCGVFVAYEYAAGGWRAME